MTPAVSVVLPALDEALALPDVLAQLPDGFEAIVVDNGSTDGTGDVARALGARVVEEPQRGFGAACAAGLGAATGDLVVFCDCDGSLDLSDAVELGDLVRNGSATMALGRRVPIARSAWPPHARLANRYLARRLRKRYGFPLTDLGPMRVARRDDWIALAVEDRRSGWPLEQLLRAGRAGWTVIERPVPYAPRAGKSKVTGTVRGTLRAVRDMRRALAADRRMSLAR